MNPLAILAIIAGLALVFRKRDPNTLPPAEAGNVPTGSGRVTPKDAMIEPTVKRALEYVVSNYGAEVARNVERIYRLETANFTSGQFHRTNTAGMHAFGASFPFGWSMAPDGLVPSDFLPTISMAENSGGTYQWVVFKDLFKAVKFLGYFLNKYGNNAGRWNSTDPAIQNAYKAKLAGIATPWADEVLNAGGASI